MALLTVDDAKAALHITDVVDDFQLQDFVDAAKVVIEDIVGPIDADTRTETFNGGGTAIVLSATDVGEVSELTINGVASTDFNVNAAAGIITLGTQYALPSRFPYGTQNVTVTYTVGSDDPPPANVRLAAIELVRFWWQEGRQPNWPNTAESEADWAPGFASVRRKVQELCQPNAKPPVIA